MRPRPVEVNRLVRAGKLSSLSPIVLLCRELGVRWLPYLDGYVYGPAPGMTELLDALLIHLKPRSLLDLFCGSGAFSLLARRRGVREVKAVDIYVETAEMNLRRLRGVEVVEGDALIFRDKTWDIVVADPPEELVGKILQNMPRLSRLYRKAAVIWLGPYHRARRRISALKTRRRCAVVECWGDAVAVLWKPDVSREKVENALTMAEAV